MIAMILLAVLMFTEMCASNFKFVIFNFACSQYAALSLFCLSNTGHPHSCCHLSVSCSLSVQQVTWCCQFLVRYYKMYYCYILSILPFNLSLFLCLPYCSFDFISVAFISKNYLTSKSQICCHVFVL